MLFSGPMMYNHDNKNHLNIISTLDLICQIISGNELESFTTVSFYQDILSNGAAEPQNCSVYVSLI